MWFNQNEKSTVPSAPQHFTPRSASRYEHARIAGSGFYIGVSTELLIPNLGATLETARRGRISNVDGNPHEKAGLQVRNFRLFGSRSQKPERLYKID